VSAEELFEMFFRQQDVGGFQFNGPRVRQRRGFAQNNGRNGNGDGGAGVRAGGGSSSWMSLLPIFFVLFVWIAGSLLSSPPPFSLVQSHGFPVMRQTMSVERLDYFVERDFGKVSLLMCFFCGERKSESVG
jgi:hypothetical protein